MIEKRKLHYFSPDVFFFSSSLQYRILLTGINLLLDWQLESPPGIGLILGSVLSVQNPGVLVSAGPSSGAKKSGFFSLPSPYASPLSAQMPPLPSSPPLITVYPSLACMYCTYTVPTHACCRPLLLVLAGLRMRLCSYPSSCFRGDECNP